LCFIFFVFTAVENCIVAYTVRGKFQIEGGTLLLMANSCPT
jgi:hypothetical protein